MTRLQIIPGDFTITDPTWPKYIVRRVITSDDFSGDGELVGSLTSAALGGVPLVWKGTSGAWVRQDGGITGPTTGSNSQEAMLSDMPADLSVSMFVTRMGTAASGSPRLIVSVRANAARTERVRLLVFSNGNISLEEYTVANGATFGPTASGEVKVGDRVGIDLRGESVTAMVNGMPILEWTCSVSGPGDVALSAYPLNDVRIDDLVITE